MESKIKDAISSLEAQELQFLHKAMQDRLQSSLKQTIFCLRSASTCRNGLKWLKKEERRFSPSDVSPRDISPCDVSPQKSFLPTFFQNLHRCDVSPQKTFLPATFLPATFLPATFLPMRRFSPYDISPRDISPHFNFFNFYKFSKPHHT